MLQGSVKSSSADGAVKSAALKSVNWSKAEAALKSVKVVSSATIRVVSVTPEIAAEWLTLNQSNRNIRKRVVETYLSDMAAGRWLANRSNPIVIGSNGRLLNGQHRLSAVVMHGKPVNMAVEFGADPEDVAAIDRGVSRSAGDAYQMNTGKAKDKFWFGIARSMRQGVTGTYPLLTTQQWEAFYNEHEKTIDYAHDLLVNTKRGIQRSPVAAAVARASYHVDRAKLEEFVDCLVSGVAPSSRYKIVITLRDWLIQNTSNGGGGSGPAPFVIYRKTARALVAFVNGEKLKTLYEISEEPFPLRDEKKVSAKRKR